MSPPGYTTMGELLDACVWVTGSGAELRWTRPQRILDAGIAPWTELPVWTPPGVFHDTLHRGDVSRALAAGLRCRPAAETVADTWAWLESLDGEPSLRTVPGAPLGLSPEKEAKALGG